MRTRTRTGHVGVTEMPSSRRAVECLAVIAALFIATSAVSVAVQRVHASAPHVLRVGTYSGVTGQYSSIQAAVNAAQPGDWILVAPGDYHERADYVTPTRPAGVWLDTPNVHLRGMDRNSVIVDGTKLSATPCSSNRADQDLGPGGQGRNGIEVHGATFTADGVSIDNLTVCNFLANTTGANGNQIWWNGGDGGGKIGLSGYSGSYLTATSTYSSSTAGTLGACCGVNLPAGGYGIFSSNSTRGSWTNDYASNMADSAFYVGACQQVCDVTLNHDHGQNSALCLSSTNAGGYFVIEHTECDHNKTGLVNTSQNNDDWPSPQHGGCDAADPSQPRLGVLGTPSCTVWMHNSLHDNNNPNVPGSGTPGLVGGGPVGTGLILAGSSDVTLYQNTIAGNNAWGELILDLPDPETAPPQVPQQCQGGIWLPSPVGICYFQATGNVSLANRFAHNGGYGNPTNGDIGLATIAHLPGNCFSRDVETVYGAPASASTDPVGIELNPLYTPVGAACVTANGGDMGPLAAEVLCASQALVSCPPAQQIVCPVVPSPCMVPPTPPIPANYPRPDPAFPLSMPPPQVTMPNPCVGVPSNPWCPSAGTLQIGDAASVPIGTNSAALACAGAGAMWRRRHPACRRASRASAMTASSAAPRASWATDAREVH